MAKLVGKAKRHSWNQGGTCEFQNFSIASGNNAAAFSEHLYLRFLSRSSAAWMNDSLQSVPNIFK